MIKIVINIILLSILNITLFATDDFSDKELTYLEHKKEIKVCVNHDFMPFEDIDKNGKHIGFSSSYFEIFEKRIPIPFKVISTKKLEQSIAFLNAKKCDIISTITASKSKDFMLLTKPYIKSPLVIAIQSHVPYISDFYNLKDKKLGISNDAEYTENIKSFFPTLNHATRVRSVEEGLNQVAEGILFGQIGTLAEIGYFFNKNFRGELKIAGKTDEVDLELSMAIHKKEPILFEIMQRFITELDSSVHYDIVSQWTAIKYEQGVNYALAIKVVGLFLFLALGAVIFLLILRNKNRKLQIIKEEIEYLNQHLEDKVKHEVQKNREKESYLFHQSRLAQMGELLSMIAHQWRQPLALINGIILIMELDLMQKKFDLENIEDREKIFEYLNKNFKEIEGYVQFLSKTVTDFTTFYQPNKTKEMVSINSPIEDALSMISSMLEIEEVLVNINYQTKKTLFLHKNEITQVILSILKNCQDNFKEKKTVNPKIEITTKEKNSKLSISISDNGGGIDENILENIFDPYFSTKDKKNGTGLGLYMSKMIIEEHHGGEIIVINNKQGVCFNINLYN